MSVSQETQKFATRAQGFFKKAVEACMEGKLSKLQQLVLEFVRDNPNCSVEEILTDFNSEGRKIIHLACSSNSKDIIDYVLENCRDKKGLVHMKDDFGMTPLINATIGEADEIIDALLAVGANADDRNQDGASAIHYAAGDGAVSRIQKLHLAGASLHCMSTSGAPLHWAAGKGRSDAIEYLIKQEVEVNVLTKEGTPAVLMAASASCDLGVQYLVEAGADMSHIVAGNLNTLHICAENGLYNAVVAILKTEAGQKCCNIETADGNKPIHLAAMVRKVDIVELLLPSYISSNGISSTQDKATLIQQVLDDGMLRMRAWEVAHDPSKAANVANGSIGTDFSTEVTTESIKVAEGYKDKGNALYKDQHFAQAIQAYTEGIKHNPRNEFLWSNRSACYLTMEEPRMALKDAEVCRQLAPSWTRGCYRLASARLALGLYEDAAVAAFEGVKIDDNNKELKTLLQLAVKKGQDEHKAKIAAQK